MIVSIYAVLFGRWIGIPVGALQDNFLQSCWNACGDAVSSVSLLSVPSSGGFRRSAGAFRCDWLAFSLVILGKVLILSNALFGRLSARYGCYESSRA